MKALALVLLGCATAALVPAAPVAPRVNSAVPAVDRMPSPKLDSQGIPRRVMAIEGQGLWPNLSVLPDGTIIATVFNQPNHGFTPGDVECWASTDGGTSWQYRSTPTRHAPQTNRMNCGAGVNQKGELVVLCSGWDHVSPLRNPKVSRPIPSSISISADGGRTWKVRETGMPPPVPGLSEHVAFGRILVAANGDLVAGTYAFDAAGKGQSPLGRIRGNLYAVRSHDGGRTWPTVAIIVDGHHCEAALLHLGHGHWLAVGRRFGDTDLEVFGSEDDAFTWHPVVVLGIPSTSSPDLLLLRDGRVMLTYGNRSPGAYGIDARLSDDHGRTWSAPERLCHLDTGDSGYPVGLQFADGRVLVAFYSSGVEQNRRYHMGVVNFFLDELVIK